MLLSHDILAMYNYLVINIRVLTSILRLHHDARVQNTECSYMS